jgi:hypothetical protein
MRDIVAISRGVDAICSCMSALEPGVTGAAGTLLDAGVPEAEAEGVRALGVTGTSLPLVALLSLALSCSAARVDLAVPST